MAHFWTGRGSMGRPGSRGDSCLDADHGVKGLDRYAAAKPPLTPWSASKILSPTRSRPQVSTPDWLNLCVEETYPRKTWTTDESQQAEAAVATSHRQLGR